MKICFASVCHLNSNTLVQTRRAEMEKWLLSSSLKRKRCDSEKSDTDSSYDDFNGNEKKKTKTTTTTRRYNEDYILLGFISSGDKNKPQLQCVICYEKLANGSLKPSLLRRHLETQPVSYTHLTLPTI